MKVFGIGLNKTGTTSLGKALEILGFDKKYQGSRLELSQKWTDGDLEPILSVAKANNNFEDWPWPMIYKELYREFDDAKFILTKRSSPEKWYESLCKHSLRTGPTEHRKLIYGYYMPQDFREEHISFYNQHNENVVNFFNQNAPQKLLVISFDDGDSWEELCDFLKKEIPDEQFPFLNQSNSGSKIASILMKNRVLRRVRTEIKRLFSL